MRAALFLLLATQAAGVLREVDPKGEGPRRHGATIISRVRGKRNKELLNAMGGGLTDKGSSSGNTKDGDKAASDKKGGALSAITKNEIPELTAEQTEALPQGDFLDMNVPFVADQQMSGDVDYKVHELERQLFQVISARDRQIVQTAIAEQEEKVAENVVSMAEVLKSGQNSAKKAAADDEAAAQESSNGGNTAAQESSNGGNTAAEESSSGGDTSGGDTSGDSESQEEANPGKKDVEKQGEKPQASVLNAAAKFKKGSKPLPGAYSANKGKKKNTRSSLAAPAVPGAY